MKMQEIIEKLRNDKKLIIFIFIGLIGAVMLIFTDNGTGNDTLNDDIETTSVNVISSAADVEEILAKYFENRYGSHAAAMRKVYELMEEAG